MVETGLLRFQLVSIIFIYSSGTCTGDATLCGKQKSKSSICSKLFKYGKYTSIRKHFLNCETLLVELHQHEFNNITAVLGIFNKSCAIYIFTVQYLTMRHCYGTSMHILTTAIAVLYRNYQ